MIHIDRSTVPVPEIFKSKEFHQFKGDWVSFNMEGGTRGTQSYFDWESQLIRFAQEAMPQLQQLFKGKCAYTERPVGEFLRDPFSKAQFEADASLVLHRPASDAVDINGVASPEHYWWLLPLWENWYLAHTSLRYAKSNTFPVDGSRTEIPSTKEDACKQWSMIDLDSGVLLDPCKDEPGFYLEFDKSGQVHTRNFAYTEFENEVKENVVGRGGLTIRILDLNSENLIGERSQVVKDFDKVFKGKIRFANVGSDQVFRNFLDENAPFIQMRRQLIAREVVDHIDIASRELIEWASSTMPVELIAQCMVKIPSLSDQQKEWIEGAVKHIEQRVPLVHEFPEFRDLFGQHESMVTATKGIDDLTEASETQGGFEGDSEEELEFEAIPPPAPPIPLPASQSEPSLKPAPKKARKKSKSVREKKKEPLVVDREARLVKVMIRNFKAIEKAEFEMPEQTWKAFLGENGTGKSCMLEAVGLALSGHLLPEVMEKTKLNWKKILRRTREGEEPVKQGSVRLEFTRGIKVHLAFNKNKHWWVGGTPQMQGYVRGYGATRLLDSGSTSTSELEANIRITNLYDPRAPVIDAEKWLLDLDEGDFNTVALVLNDLLGSTAAQHVNADEKVITRSEGEVLVNGDPLDLVSDGYRAVIAITCDIMAGLGTGLSSIRDAAQGIVLIDEIGAHLHPRWRMAITETLRSVLPKIQFIVSTHEPLCLRGLREKEVVRVRKSRTEGVTLEEIERSPSAYRVDQLLTSEFFGMDTTIDPELEARFQAYYRLLAQPESERPDNYEEVLKEQKDYIDANSNTILGTTRRDQLVYEILDEYLAKKDIENPTAAALTREEAMQKITDIWDMGKFAANYTNGRS